MIIASTIEEKLRSIVGNDNFRAATVGDAVSGMQPQFVAEPASEPQLAAVLSCANEAGIAIIPRGGATKLAWGNPPKRAGMILSTARLNRVLEHAWADLTVTVEAGCTLRALQERLAQHGQRLALDGLWPEQATVGGALSTNDSGALRLRFGALRDLIIGVTLALPDGTLACSGGKVVKNVAGYDLPKLATGALGTLGVITRAIFRLHPLPSVARTVTCITEGIPKAEFLIARSLDSSLAFSALQTRFVTGKHPKISIDFLFEGTNAGVAAQMAHVESLVASLPVTETDPSVWRAREELHSDALASQTSSVLFKMSAPPEDAIRAIGNLLAISASRATFDAVVQATGLGTVLLKGDKGQVRSILEAFRQRMDSAGGSLVILGSSPLASDIDAWGPAGDALPLMRAVKSQLDPRETLNPGRFVGGI